MNLTMPIPFKVISRFPVGITHGYEMLLVELKDFNTNTEFEWHKSGITKLVVDVNGREKLMKRVVLTKELHTHYFLPGDTTFVTYSSRSNKTIPQYIEFSYASLYSPRFCGKGLVMLTSAENCPLAFSCPYYESRGSTCAHLIHYKGVTYPELFEIEPLIRAENDHEHIKTLLHLFYKDLPFIKINQIRSDFALLYVDKVVIKNRLRSMALCFILEPKYKPSRVVRATYGLSITYYREALRNLTERILTDETIMRALEYRYYLLVKSRPSLSTPSIIQRVIEDINNYISLRSNMYMTLGKNFVDFCEYMIAHLISHILIQLLCKETGINMRNVYHSIHMNDDTIEAIIISNNPLIHQIINILEKKPISLLNNVVTEAQELIQREKIEVTSSEQAVYKNIKIKRVLKAINEFIKTAECLPHPVILWGYMNSKLKSLNEKFIDKLISFIINVSGAKTHKLITIKNCFYDPITQWILFTPQILPPLLTELETILTNSKLVPLLNREKSNLQLLNSILSLAISQVYIVTSNLSPNVIKRLIMPHLQRGIYIHIITRNTLKGGKEITAQKRGELKVKSSSISPQKFTLIVIDNKIALTGHWNLTSTDLKSKDKETLLIYDPEKAKTLINYLETDLS